ncbi:signal peptide-containing protein [Theileria equi strain WA]|uniref:Signal peptide-containing protein n=1 Tax=Theileria equi strain WA TaxID=1537102 RepID=L0AYC2_THEEQ|nr:signal peptide-containing protein [Theileria equi strain WA]AFZ80565.1 signal peptide-containing protein [Theileria equi strain WA]|eukprot:XP_004830231.1 signal peptide-containing protein [Theileria equi strain WA]
MVSSITALTSLISFIAATMVACDGKCGEGDLKTLGMVKVDGDEAQLKALFKTTAIMSHVGQHFGKKAGDQSVDLYSKYLGQLLGQFGVQGVDAGCVSCFAESVKCSVKNCKVACMNDSCAAGCVKCFEKNCKPALSDCVGGVDLDTHCRDKTNFKKFKLSQTPKGPE